MLSRLFGDDVSICVPIVFGKIKIGIIILKLCASFSCTGSRPYERRSSMFIKTLEVAFEGFADGA